MNLKILSPDNNKLRNPCSTISSKELRLKATQDLIEELLNFVYGNNNKGRERNKSKPTTVGLSANQVGIPRQISIIDLAIGHKAFNDIHTLVNPKIIWISKSIISRPEGCVNLPNIWGVVERSSRVKVEALDRSGNKLLFDIHGWAAILLQHEIDHLNGKLFIDLLVNPKKAHLVHDTEFKNYKKNYPPIKTLLTEVDNHQP